MKIHCITLTKNEDDVVGLCLKEAEKWADHIYVYDGASTDATWDIVKSLESDVIIPWKQDGKVFGEGLRAEVFQQFRHMASEGDWWVELNADEFFTSNTKDILSGITGKYSLVYGVAIDYVITKDDLSKLDFSLPVEQLIKQLKWHRFWSEPRAFRYRPRLHWPLDWKIPQHPGSIAAETITFKHYQYRSPKQIQTRLNTRRDNRARGFAGWDHASQLDWKDKIFDPAGLEHDDDAGVLSASSASRLKHGDPLWRRAFKRVMHGAGIWP